MGEISDTAIYEMILQTTITATLMAPFLESERNEIRRRNRDSLG